MSESTSPNYTSATQAWLDRSFATTDEHGVYFAHQPIYGFGVPNSSPAQAPRIARTLRILSLLAGEEFSEFLDVGAGEAYSADLVREAFGARVMATDLSREICWRGQTLFGVPTVACNGAALPYADRSFDCVLCSEVIEHLEDPFAVIAELMRVTRRVLLITTAECAHSELERQLLVKLRDFEKPHLEINWWMRNDFTRVMGDQVRLERQIRLDRHPSDREGDREAVKRWILWSIDPVGLEREGFGIFALWRRPGSAQPSGKTRLNIEEWTEKLMRGRPTGLPLPAAEADWAREKLRCPLCLGSLASDATGAVCRACESHWPRYKETILDLSVTRSVPVREPAELAPQAVRRLRRLFDPRNVWQGWRLTAGRILLSLVECLRDLRMRRGWRTSLRNLRSQLGQIKRDLDPSMEGSLIRARGEQAIYRIERGRRRHITTQQLFFDLGYNYDQVKLVDPEVVARFPEGEPITKV